MPRVITSLLMSSPPISISHRLFRCRYSKSRDVRSCKLSARAPRRACSQATVLLLPFYIFPQALSFCVLCFAFQIQTTWCSPGNLPFFLFIYIWTCIRVHRTIFEKKKQFSGLPSRGLKWESKTYKLKCSIVFDDWKKRNSFLLAPPLPPF